MSDMPEKLFVRRWKGYCTQTDCTHWMGDDFVSPEGEVEYIRADASSLARSAAYEAGHQIGAETAGCLHAAPTATLRDQFAMAALTGMLASRSTGGNEKVLWEWADAMMKAREGGE